VFIRFDRIHERDGRTDKQTDRQTPFSQINIFTNQNFDFEDVFIRFDRIHERDGRTDKQTDRQTPTSMTASAAFA